MSLRLVVACLLVCHAAAARAQDDLDLTGVWVGEGYRCFDASGATTIHDEEVEIAIENGVFTATKIEGDPCVGPGETTWRAQEAVDAAVGSRFAVDSRLGTPSGARSWSTGEIEIVDPDTLYWRHPGDFFPVIFRRRAPPVS